LLLFLLFCGCAKLPGDLGLLPTPAIPSTPAISSVVSGNGSVTVTWHEVKGADSYNLFYSAGATIDTVNGTIVSGKDSTMQVTGLTNGTQYAFAVSAVNAGGESELSAIQTATPQAAVVTGSVTDTDGNVYHTVTIGTQVWMAENLKTTKYNDGSPIPLVTASATWASLTTPGYCWYNDSSTYGNTYGALYNWYAVNAGKLAPTGWHVPTDSEWEVLGNYLGGDNVAGGPLKEAGTTHWSFPNTGATNTSGFSALPGGCRSYDGPFNYIGFSGYWWSSTAYGATNAWYRHMYYSNANVFRFYDSYTSGFSVRCVKDNNTNPPSAPVISSVVAGDSSVTVSWNTITGATSYNLYYAAGTTVTAATGTKLTSVTSPKQVTGLTNGTQYAFAVSAVNTAGESGLSAVQTATPQAGGNTVTDTDGNVYHTVTIGTQVWMVENLKTTKYNNGTAIPLVTDGTAWGNLTTPGYCWSNNDAGTYKATYGALYNWYAVNTGKLAPTGWHVPTDSEWTVLTTYLGGDNGAGGPMKETGTTHWISPNTGATNSSGFSALPGGCRNYYGVFTDFGDYGYWWSATASDATYSLYRSMFFDGASVDRNYNLDVYGFSVRCVRDNNTSPPLAPVISSAVAGDGGVTVNWNAVIGASSYNLYYAAGTAVTIATGTKLTGVTSPKLVATLTNGTQYAFAVSAVNAGGESGLSAVKTATPQVTVVVPSAPTISSATPGNASATVSWNTASSATSYNLYYAAGTTVTLTTGTKVTGVTSPKQVAGLTNGTQYAFAVSAVNTAGESGLSTIQTATPQAALVTGAVTDTDGNVYDTVTIGTQVWMTSNLKTTKYNDGSAIPPVTDNTAWSNLGTPGYCWYNNDSVTNKATYGALYNWYAVNTKKLAPTGWHVPTDSEWTVLENWLTVNGYNYDGTTTGNNYAKSLASQTNWTTSTTTGAVGNNPSTNNRTGFSGLPGGYRYYNGTFATIGDYGYWWSATAYNATDALGRYMLSGAANVIRFYDHCTFGYSVRCVRDP
jgi:uncharacterized protein (TIGR02145 family)